MPSSSPQATATASRTAIITPNCSIRSRGSHSFSAPSIRAAAAGITSFCVVLGFEADRVRATVEKDSVPGTTLRFVYNPDWHLENGVSAMAARQHCGSRRFALLMGDHVFEPAVLERMLSVSSTATVSLLAVDSLSTDPVIAAEATRVRMSGGLITAIGKERRSLRRARYRPVRVFSGPVRRARVGAGSG